jgi:uncharacterized protein
MNSPSEKPRFGLLAKPWMRCVAYVLVGYVGLVLMLVAFENRLVYIPTTGSLLTPAGIQDVELTSADGTRLHAWWCPSKDSELALLYCHGNAGNLSQRGGSVITMRNLLHTSVLIIDYPGYGKSEGSPSEQGCYLAADAAYAWLTAEKKIAPGNILLYGASLGGGVAVDLASRKDHRALILVKTFTSVPDVACDIYWWLPVPIRVLMVNRFESLGKIHLCRRPVFIAHGTSDRMIPYHHGQNLYEAANEPKQLFPLPGDHNDQLPTEMFAALNEFLRQHP